jgi:hypothetical protein
VAFGAGYLSAARACGSASPAASTGAATLPLLEMNVRHERQGDPVFDKSLLEDVSVREALQPFLPQMDRVVASRTQPFDDALRQDHVGENAHGACATGE